MSVAEFVTIECACGGTLRRDSNGRAVCRLCRSVVSMESLLVRGLSPMWFRGTLVTHKENKR